MAELVPIKIKITKGVRNGKSAMIYPEFNNIEGALRNDMDWSVFFDVYGIGHHYDKTSGLDVSDAHYSVTCVPEGFANAAEAMFPNEVEILTEAEFADFYDNKAHKHERDNREDPTVLQTIAAKKQIGLALTQEDNDALDPTKDTPGITENKKKTWAKYKSVIGVTIKAKVIEAPVIE